MSKQVVSVDNMRRSDAATIARSVPSLELMRRAAQGIFDACDWPGHTAVVAGSGNNGGDGYALAEILHDHGMDVSIHMVSEKASEDGRHYLERARVKGVPVSMFDPEDMILRGADTIADCLLGTGFRGTPRQNVADAIRFINASGARVVSADINSGMDGETGRAQMAVRSDLTVSVGYLKNGMFLNQARDYIGKLVNAEIGIELEHLENLVANEDEFEDMLVDGNPAQVPFSEDAADPGAQGASGNGGEGSPSPVERAMEHSRQLGRSVWLKGSCTEYIATPERVVFRQPDWLVL